MHQPSQGQPFQLPPLIPEPYPYLRRQDSDIDQICDQW